MPNVLIKPHIICYAPLNRVSKVFNWISVTQGYYNTYFKSELNNYDKVTLYTSIFDAEPERIIDDSIFSDVTFRLFEGFSISKFSVDAFRNTADRIFGFSCYNCPLVHQPPKYDIYKMINQLINLSVLKMSLNVTEIPENAFVPITNRSELVLIELKSFQNLTIKSNAFQNLTKIDTFTIYDTTIKSIKKNAFKFPAYKIVFGDCKLTGDSFEVGSFDGLKPKTDINGNSTSIHILFERTNINYLPEKVFKPFLESNKNNTIGLTCCNNIITESLIDCSDCRNNWLIKDTNFQNQIVGGYCDGEGYSKTLFSDEIKTQLSKKCK